MNLGSFATNSERLADNRRETKPAPTPLAVRDLPFAETAIEARKKAARSSRQDAGRNPQKRKLNVAPPP